MNARSIAIVLWHFLMTFLLSMTFGGFDMDVTCPRIISFLIEYNRTGAGQLRIEKALSFSRTRFAFSPLVIRSGLVSVDPFSCFRSRVKGSC